MRRVVQLTIAVWLGGSAAYGQPAPTAEATRLFEEGRALAKQSDFAAACDRFARSFKLVPAPGTALNLADCDERQHHLADAWRLFDHAATEAEQAGNAERAKFARDRADRLVPQLTTVLVKVEQPGFDGLSITIAGRQVPVAAEIREYVDPGVIAVVATAPGSPGFARSTEGVAGATLEVDVPALDGIRVGEPVAPTERRASRVNLAYGLTGFAGALAITSVVFLLKGKSDYDTAANGPNCQRDVRLECNPTGLADIAHAQREGDISTAFALGAGLVFAGAVVVYVTAPRDPIAVTPVVDAHTVGFVIDGAF